MKMKTIVLILIYLLTSNAFIYSQSRPVSAMTELSSLSNTDLFWVLTDSSGLYKGRKLYWSNLDIPFDHLTSAAQDSVQQVRLWKNNTFTGSNTFSGSNGNTFSTSFLSTFAGANKFEGKLFIGESPVPASPYTLEVNGQFHSKDYSVFDGNVYISGNITNGAWLGSSIDTTYTNAVSKITAGVGITATKNNKDYKISVDTTRVLSTYGGTLTGIPTFSNGVYSPFKITSASSHSYLYLNAYNYNYSSIIRAVSGGINDIWQIVMDSTSLRIYNFERTDYPLVINRATGATTLQTVYIPPDSLTSSTLDCSKSNTFIYQLDGNNTVTFSNFAEGQTINVIVHNSGSYTIAFSGGTILWPADTQPVQTASATDIYIFQKVGGYIRADARQYYAH